MSKRNIVFSIFASVTGVIVLFSITAGLVGVWTDDSRWSQTSIIFEGPAIAFSIISVIWGLLEVVGVFNDVDY